MIWRRSPIPHRLADANDLPLILFAAVIRLFQEIATKLGGWAPTDKRTIRYALGGGAPERGDALPQRTCDNLYGEGHCQTSSATPIVGAKMDRGSEQRHVARIMPELIRSARLLIEKVTGLSLPPPPPPDAQIKCNYEEFDGHCWTQCTCDYGIECAITGWFMSLFCTVWWCDGNTCTCDNLFGEGQCQASPIPATPPSRRTPPRPIPGILVPTSAPAVLARSARRITRHPAMLR